MEQVRSAKKEELESALCKALRCDSKVLIERGIVGKEIECAVLGSDVDVFTSSLGEVIPSNSFYDYESKYKKASKLKGVSDLPGSVVSYVQQLAKKVYTLLGCSGLARVDFFIERETGDVFLNEINTFPGFTASSMYPKLMLDSGFTVEELLEKLIIFARKKRDMRKATE